MAYNYDPLFLQTHEATVKTLVKVAANGEVIKYTSSDSRVISSQQYLVNNLLASLARNVPEYGKIRSVIRCWTEYHNGTYTLYVGKPQHRVEGRPPGRERPAWATIFINQGATGTRYVHDETLDSEETMLKFTGIVINLPNHILTAETVVEELTPEALEYFRDVFAPHGWTPSIDGRKLILTRSPT
jgi:hypothetical protein